MRQVPVSRPLHGKRPMLIERNSPQLDNATLA